MLRNRFLHIVLLIALTAAMPLLAQETSGHIAGTVADASGGALPGVTVEAVSQRGQRFTTVTDSAGNYRFPALPPGIYSVTGTLAGMEPATARNVSVTLGASPRADLRLRIGAVSETLTVTAEAPVVDVTTSATSTNIRSEEFESLPKGRGFESIVTLAAGANNDPLAAGISIDGATALENRFVVDGVDTTDPFRGGVGKRVITDIIDEVQIKSGGYEAEFGGATGGVINVITKTGTNAFAGSVTGYFRDRGWNGAERRSLQSNAAGSAPEYVTFDEDSQTIVEPGVTIGGPILRDRLWFFGAYHPSIRTTERTVTFRNPGTFPARGTFEQENTQTNILANLNGSIGSRAVFKIAANISPTTVDTPNLPGRSGRGAANPANYSGLTDEYENETYSGNIDFIPSPMFHTSVRGGVMKTDFRNLGVPSDQMKWFRLGSPTAFPEGAGQPAQGFRTVANNTATVFDKFNRENISFDVSAFPTFMGTHNIKAGVQFENLTNDVFSGTQAPVYAFHWNRNDRFFAERGTYGAFYVYLFGTSGAVESENRAYFLQDSWTTMNNRLTLNLGVRATEEKIPDYDGVGEPLAIDFGISDTVTPRLGFAYDIFGNGRSKAYGSFGRFIDQTKLALARGAFGGEKWVAHSYKLNTLDWQSINCTGVSNTPGAKPTCTGAVQYINSIDLRHPSTESIDPDIQPMTSQEYTLGVQQDLGANMSLGLRYVHKELLRTIEDLGTRIITPGGTVEESYTIGNPGFGQSVVGTAAIPGFPKAVRDYDGLELEFTRRMTNNWALHASYLFSRLYGNYPGLAGGDEANATLGTARTDPNILRWGDLIPGLFDASGSKEGVMGRLPTDRPHQFKAQATYAFPVGTTVALNQYVGSGTPVSTQMLFHGVEFFPFGRGDLGRTDMLTSTDLLLAHRFNFGGRFGLQIEANVLNLFDEDTATFIYQLSNTGDVSGVVTTDEAFFRGYDAGGLQGTLSKDVLFQQEGSYQEPREVRLGLRLIF